MAVGDHEMILSRVLIKLCILEVGFVETNGVARVEQRESPVFVIREGCACKEREIDLPSPQKGRTV